MELGWGKGLFQGAWEGRRCRSASATRRGACGGADGDDGDDAEFRWARAVVRLLIAKATVSALTCRVLALP
ncbi:hypothetical protein NKH18_47950 [Streptomyces sp. M10(2022)]